MIRLPLFTFFVLAFIVVSQIVYAQPIVVNHLNTDISQIPANWIDSAKASLKIAYGHTSHGSQLVTGMEALLAYHGNVYNFNSSGEDGALTLYDGAMDGDVGYYPDWVDNTRSYLGTPNGNGRGSDNPQVNVVIWSWCGQIANKYQNAALYSEFLQPMNELEQEYFGIKFVYMTGHLDYWSFSDHKAACDSVRRYCEREGKVLFDFPDIESYDPDGTHFEFSTDNCDYYDAEEGDYVSNWAIDWMAANPGNVMTQEAAPVCDDSCCAHSRRLNCVLKGRAAWWLWARLAGWDGNATDVKEPSGKLLQGLNVAQNYPNPFNPSTTIEFTLQQRSRVLLKVYNILGNEVATLIDGEKEAGVVHRIQFDASALSSGVYFYRLTAGEYVQVKKLIIMK